MPHRWGAQTFERALPSQAHFDDETGDLVIDEAGDKPFTALWKAVGDVFIENLSEEAGETIMRAMGKVTPGFVKRPWRKVAAKLPKGAKLKNAFDKLGVQSYPAETAEEYYGAFLRAVTGIEGEGDIGERIGATIPGVGKSWEDVAVEQIVLALPGAMRVDGIAGESAKKSIDQDRADKLKALPDEELFALAAKRSKNPMVRQEILSRIQDVRDIDIPEAEEVTEDASAEGVNTKENTDKDLAAQLKTDEVSQQPTAKTAVNETDAQLVAKQKSAATQKATPNVAPTETPDLAKNATTEPADHLRDVTKKVEAAATQKATPNVAPTETPDLAKNATPEPADHLRDVNTQWKKVKESNPDRVVFIHDTNKDEYWSFGTDVEAVVSATGKTTEGRGNPGSIGVSGADFEATLGALIKAGYKTATTAMDPSKADVPSVQTVPAALPSEGEAVVSVKATPNVAQGEGTTGRETTEEWSGTLPPARDGHVRVYHSTDADVESISSQGLLTSGTEKVHEGGMYVHVTPTPQSKYGKNVIAVDVPESQLTKKSKNEWIVEGEGVPPGNIVGVYPAIQPAPAKPPWEMTKGEYESGLSPTAKKVFGGWQHRNLVLNALAEGEAVSDTVTKDYPGIVEEAKTIATESDRLVHERQVLYERVRTEKDERKFAKGRAAQEEMLRRAEATSSMSYKEPWEITIKQYVVGGRITNKLKAQHKAEVQKALSEGKPVPPEVLADYPDLAAKQQPAPAPARVPTLDEAEQKYPRVGPVIDGRAVRKGIIPNLDSIDASVEHPIELKGVRDVKMADFTLDESPIPKDKASLSLAEEIKQSGEVTPLIVGIDELGPYIIEGGHRYDALRVLGAKSFPAIVVLEGEAADLGRTERQLVATQPAPAPAQDPSTTAKPGTEAGEDNLSDTQDQEDTTLTANAEQESDKYTANLSDTLEPGAGELVRLDRTSARQEHTNADRESMGLNVLPSPSRVGWQQNLDDAKEQRIPERALRIAGEIQAAPRPLSATETAGLVIRAVELKREHRGLVYEMRDLDNKADLRAKAEEIRRVQEEFDLLTDALKKSGTEKGRALAAQKLTLDQDFDLITVTNRAKASRGKALSDKLEKRFAMLTEALEDAVARVDVLEKDVSSRNAVRAIEVAGMRKYSRMSTREKDADLESTASRLRELMAAQCYDVI